MSEKSFFVRAVRQAALLLLLAVPPTAAVVLWHPQGPTLLPPEIEGAIEVTPEEVRTWGEVVLWADARETREFLDGHLPGAVPLNETDWEEQLDDFLDAWLPGTRVVVYCGGHDCQASRAVAGRLAVELGADAGPFYFLKGGIDAWRASQE